MLNTLGAVIRFRGLLPNVPGAASANAAVLNHWLISCERGRSVLKYGSGRTRSPRSCPTPESERSWPEVMFTGRPERHVQMPLLCQPPNAARTKRGARLSAGRL